MRKKGFTLIELLVVIAIIAMLLAILMPALNKVKKIAQRVVCGTNSKGLGTAQMVYANDYDGAYAIQYHTGVRTVSDRTSGCAFAAMPWATTAGTTSIGASLYLLVREADVSPKSFVCPSGAEIAYDGQNPNQLDITELWDFGMPNGNFGDTGPTRCLSYSYHNPYTQFAADDTRSAAFAVMADKSPWYDPKLTRNGVGGFAIDASNWLDGVWLPKAYWLPAGAEKWEKNRANAQPHSRDGQNVLFGDGHNSFEKTADIGVNHDAIYTRHGTQPDERVVRAGAVPAANYPLDIPAGSSDSFLVNDIPQ